MTDFSRSSRGVQRFVDFFFLLCLPDADWLSGQTLITWFEVCPYYSANLSPKIPQPIVRKIHVHVYYVVHVVCLA